MASSGSVATAEPTHVVQLLEQQAERIPDHPALTWIVDGVPAVLTWAQYRHQVWSMASRFLELGVEPGETVAIFAPNVVEHYVADLAASLCGAATVSLYPTLVDEQLIHVLADARPVLVITQDGRAAERLSQALPKGSRARFICVGTGAELADGNLSWAEAQADGYARLQDNVSELRGRLADSRTSDPATYVYTSGTTGMPKGVTLTHGNLLSEIDAFDRMGFFIGGYRVVSYLPLAHVAERLWSLYFPLRTGGTVMLCPEQGQLLSYLKLQRPTFFMGVPRVWEKLRDAALAMLSSEPYASRAEEVAADRAVLLEDWARAHDDNPSAAGDRTRALKAREGILHQLRRDLGLDSTVNPASGAAGLPEDLRDFWRSIGVDLTQAYGLSETTGVATWERIGGARRGSAGYAVPGCEIRIAGDGEILLRGQGMTPGYRNLDRNASGLFVGDWLATGDIGYLDEAGRLYVTDRKKELIVNASGKNISPTAVEEKIAGCGFINQAVAVGDARPYVTALLNVDPSLLVSFASERGIEGAVSELVCHPAVVEEAQRWVDRANERLSRPEQIKRFRLLTEQWSVESGDLTPTFKLRRRILLARHADLIDSVYGERRDGAS